MKPGRLNSWEMLLSSCAEVKNGLLCSYVGMFSLIRIIVFVCIRIRVTVTGTIYSLLRTVKGEHPNSSETRWLFLQGALWETCVFLGVFVLTLGSPVTIL